MSNVDDILTYFTITYTVSTLFDTARSLNNTTRGVCIMNAITRFKKIDTVVPQNLTEANVAIRVVGDLQSQMNDLEATLAAQIKKLQVATNKKLGALSQEQNNAVSGLFTFADKYKQTFTVESKTIDCADGVFGWRMTPPSVGLAMTEREAIALLKASRKKRFVRIKESLDKEMLLAKRPTVAGITYDQHEEFFVKPKRITSRKKTFTRAVDK